ncbi:hypothetical protein C8F01DRAFT_1147456 [Mycena amicta]|nr:hypothetical protein C8F01DRAFT_1147456 [Mycena amicta]
MQTHLGSMAIELVDQLYAGKSVDVIQDDVEAYQGPVYFTSVDNVVNDAGEIIPKNPKEIFRQPFVLGTLAKFCKLTKDLQGVLRPRDDDKPLAGMHPCGAARCTSGPVCAYPVQLGYQDCVPRTPVHPHSRRTTTAIVPANALSAKSVCIAARS